MQPIRHVVAGTDFSAEADLAVLRAALISKHLGAELHLVHVIHPLDLYVGSELSFGFQTHYQQAQQELIKTQIETLASKLRERFGIPIHAATRIGRAHAEISDYANSVKAGLIVAGAQGEHSLLEKLLGSTSSRLLRVAKCPMLIVKNKNAMIPAYQQVIAAVNFSLGAADVPALARIVAPEAHIEALLIFDTNQEAHMYKAGMNEVLLQKYRTQALIDADKRLNEILTEQVLGERVSRKILTGYPPESICAHAKAQHADLIVIGKHEKNDIEDFLLGSVSKGVAYAAECDVLISN
ncbi:universal stress protein [Methylotenera sp.]|jgi:nucleotide-binding universal stress UspA family protein|uniref:universal stress protein n=1 Tax=Methylotenera sp. TaxID=2051956 RepID=UPI0027211037|nr:universal stress protein [Methylotenera sp.]MDO9204559.1 universal stress protein [Methylotenera sp.]MDO9394499.1 universal stress protein [Methylotenera sp.]MDP1523242.1 universal stress protein [Methylotenera sp.]MDP2071461.1 universal stress protein [Methylotenera sp.]MDP2230380.1 universal stress protein [Methylotenera sp.]